MLSPHHIFPICEHIPFSILLQSVTFNVKHASETRRSCPMKSLTVFVALLLLAPNIFAAQKKFKCYSKQTAANPVKVSITGTIDSDTRISDLKAVDESNGLRADIDEAHSDYSYSRRKYLFHNLFYIPNTHGSENLDGVYFLLPRNISTLSGEFSAQVSDILPGINGSGKYFETRCKITR